MYKFETGPTGRQALISIGRSSVKVTAAPAPHGSSGRDERGDPRGEWKAFCNRR